MKHYLPSVLTLANLAAGIIACALAVNGRPELAGLVIILAVFMDSLDGALARKLGASSDFGLELDSLADMVSFGAAPAIVVGTLLPEEVSVLGWCLLIAFPLCAAWRLAKFNIGAGEDEHGDFVGLPTTGAGGAVATGVLLFASLARQGVEANEALLLCMMVLLALLMVSRFRYRHIGSVIARMPRSLAVALMGLIVVTSVLWEHEIVFAVVCWGYAISGPVCAFEEKLIAFRTARTG